MNFGFKLSIPHARSFNDNNKNTLKFIYSITGAIFSSVRRVFYTNTVIDFDTSSNTDLNEKETTNVN